MSTKLHTLLRRFLPYKIRIADQPSERYTLYIQDPVTKLPLNLPLNVIATQYERRWWMNLLPVEVDERVVATVFVSADDNATVWSRVYQRATDPAVAIADALEFLDGDVNWAPAMNQYLSDRALRRLREPDTHVE